MMNNNIRNFEDLASLLIDNKRNNILPEDCYPAIEQWYKAQTGYDESEKLQKFAVRVERNTDLAERLEQREEGLSEYFCRAIKDYDLSDRWLRLRQL